MNSFSGLLCLALLFAATEDLAAADKSLQEKLMDLVVDHLKTIGPDVEVVSFVNSNTSAVWGRRVEFFRIIAPYLSKKDTTRISAGIAVLARLRHYRRSGLSGYRDTDQLDPAFFAQVDKAVYDNFDYFYSLDNGMVLKQLATYISAPQTPEAKERLLRIINHPAAKSGKGQALICFTWARNPEHMEILLPFMLENSPAARSLPYHFRNSYGEAAVPYLKKALTKARSKVTRLEAAFALTHLRVPDGFEYVRELALKNPEPEGKQSWPIERIRQFAADYLELPKGVLSKEEIAAHIEEKQHTLCRATK